MRLTKQSVARLTIPQGKSEALIFDDALSGFGIRLRAGGRRTWVVQYRTGQKQRRVTLGTVEALDADAARKEAKSVLARAQLGSDPQAEKRLAAARASLTLGAVVDRYLSIYAELHHRPRTLQEVRRSLTQHWRTLHEVPVHRITRASIASRLTEIATESGPTSANRARSYLSAALTWATRQGLIDANPVVGTGRPAPEVSRDRVLSDDELRLIWACASSGDYAAILKLLILTGQRREEVAGLTWEELALDRRNWTIGRQRSKNGSQHEVPLSDAAVAILEARLRRPGRSLVFGAGAGSFSGWSRAKEALDARVAAVNGKALVPWRLHDLRRTAATRMADLGTQPHVIEAVLNHLSGFRGGLGGVYNRSPYAAEKRAALELWASHLMQLLDGDNK